MLGQSALFNKDQIPSDLLEFFEPAECGRCYICEMVAVFRQVKRVLRDDGTLWLNLGDSYAGNNAPGFRAGNEEKNGGASNKNGVGAVNGAKPKDLLMIPARVALALQADGLFLRSQMPWLKRSAMPESVTDRPVTATEYVYLFTKQPRYFYDAEAIKRVSADSSLSRAFRNSDLFFDSLEPPHGAITDVEGSIVALDVNTAGFSESHFATFPPRLIESLIRAATSERGCCPKCAAPWVRQTERVDTGRKQKMADGWDTGSGSHGAIHREGREKGEAGMPVLTTITTGWLPSCSCNAGEPVPCTVLDPFSGAGTTALVADRLGRNAIGIELSETYCDMARRRIEKDAGMFAEIA